MTSTFNIGLIIGTSTKTGYLTPDSINLYDNLDARTALSFQMKMPTSDTRPVIGQPVYLTSGTTYGYSPTTGFLNPTFSFGSTALKDTVGLGWVQAATNYWVGYIGTTQSRIDFTNGIATLLNQSAASTDYVYMSQTHLGLYSSNAIPIENNQNYLISLSYAYSRAVNNGGYASASLFAGTNPTTLAFYKTIFTTNTGIGDWGAATYLLENSSYNYVDIWFLMYTDLGTLELTNLSLQKVLQPCIFGGTLDNYNETCYPFTNELQLNCNAVDFTQMLGKRRVYKSYVSSGLGEYDSIATTDSFITDGACRVWTLSYPLLTTPTLTADGFPVSSTAIGEYGVSTDCKWYFTPSSFLILYSTTEAAAPAAGTTMHAIYTGVVGKNAWDSDIIRDLNTNFFNGEGINCSSTLGYIKEGVRIPELNFNYIPGNEAINMICNITGYSWYIDPWKRLHYFPRTENPAPFNINSTSNNWRSLTVNRSRDKYRNKEYVIGSYGYTPQTESFNGDGYTRTFSLSYPVYDMPVITIDGFKATVGIAGVSASTFGYYWSKESNIITGNSSNLALASSDYITISYLGIYPVVAIASDGEEIIARAAVEQNSGIYEDATNSNKTYTGTAAIAYGNSILSKYGKQLEQVEFETDIDGLQSGQLIHIHVDNNDLDDYYYITSVTARDVDMATMRYRVVAVSGTDRGGWVSFFRDLVSGNNALYSEPYTNLVQTSLIVASGNIRFIDSGLTVTVTPVTIAVYDTAVYDTGVYS